VAFKVECSAFEPSAGAFAATSTGVAAGTAADVQ
jgi:hypothetical protein